MSERKAYTPQVVEPDEVKVIHHVAGATACDDTTVLRVDSLEETLEAAAIKILDQCNLLLLSMFIFLTMLLYGVSFPTPVITLESAPQTVCHFMKRQIANTLRQVCSVSRSQLFLLQSSYLQMLKCSRLQSPSKTALLRNRVLGWRVTLRVR